MKTKQVSLFGFAVLLLAAMCVVAACDTGTGGSGSSGGTNPLSGTTWKGKQILNSMTEILTLKFTSDSEYQITSVFPDQTNTGTIRKGTYTLTGTMLTLTDSYKESQTAVYMDNTITLNSESGGIITFTKQ